MLKKLSKIKKDNNNNNISGNKRSNTHNNNSNNMNKNKNDKRKRKNNKNSFKKNSNQIQHKKIKKNQIIPLFKKKKKVHKNTEINLNRNILNSTRRPIGIIRDKSKIFSTNYQITKNH